jgi:hypothetical protein
MTVEVKLLHRQLADGRSLMLYNCAQRETARTYKVSVIATANVPPVPVRLSF